MGNSNLSSIVLFVVHFTYCEREKEEREREETKCMYTRTCTTFHLATSCCCFFSKPFSLSLSLSRRNKRSRESSPDKVGGGSFHDTKTGLI